MDQPTTSTAARRPLRAVLERFTTSAHVEMVELVTPRLRRIRLTGPALRDLPWRPGQHVRVVVRPPRLRDLGRDLLRSYSVWRHDGNATLDLGVLDHPDAGPGATWAGEVRPGMPVSFLGPEGRFGLRPGAHHLFVGDETAGTTTRLSRSPLRLRAQCQKIQGHRDAIPDVSLSFDQSLLDAKAIGWAVTAPTWWLSWTVPTDLRSHRGSH